MQVAATQQQKHSAPSSSQHQHRKRQKRELPEWAAGGDCGGAATSSMHVSQKQVTAAAAVMRKEKKRGEMAALLAAMGRTTTGGAATTGNGDCFFNAQQQYNAIQLQSSYPYHPTKQQLKEWEEGHEQQRQSLADLIDDREDVRQLVVHLEQLPVGGRDALGGRSISKKMSELMSDGQDLSPAHAYAEVIKVPCSTGPGALSFILLHFMICHSGKCHRPLTSSPHKYSMVEQNTSCLWHSTYA